jgi:hydrogenase maturation protease
MKTEPPRVLVIGHGNPGRQDDGLGPALAAALEAKSLPHVTVEAAYLLEPEAAELVSRHDVAVFADAAVAGPEPFSVQAVCPAETVTFSSHGLGPPEIMGLAHRVFGSAARGYVLGIRGYEFDEFEEALSKRARENLEQAERHLEELIRSDGFPSLGESHSLPAPVAARPQS